MTDTNESILQEAHRLTHGPRNVDYGHPLDDYTRTAALVSALLAHKLTSPITPDEMTLCMCCVKMSRHINAPKRDNMVDLAGYAWCTHACAEEADRRNGVGEFTPKPPGYGKPLAFGDFPFAGESPKCPSYEEFAASMQIPPMQIQQCASYTDPVGTIEQTRQAHINKVSGGPVPDAVAADGADIIAQRGQYAPPFPTIDEVLEDVERWAVEVPAIRPLPTSGQWQGGSHAQTPSSAAAANLIENAPASGPLSRSDLPPEPSHGPQPAP